MIEKCRVRTPARERGITILFNRIGNYVKTLLNTDFHQPDFMKQEGMNLKYLLIIWINYD